MGGSTRVVDRDCLASRRPGGDFFFADQHESRSIARNSLKMLKIVYCVNVDYHYNSNQLLCMGGICDDCQER